MKNASVVDKHVIRFKKVLHCEKCRNERMTDGITIEYREAYNYEGSLVSPEDLKWTCKRCGFIWYTETLDKYKEE